MVIEVEAYEMLTSQVNELCTEVAWLKERIAPKPRRWLDVQDVCLALNISKRTLQYYRDTGVIRYKWIGNKTYYKEEDIHALLESRRIKPKTK